MLSLTLVMTASPLVWPLLGLLLKFIHEIFLDLSKICRRHFIGNGRVTQKEIENIIYDRVYSRQIIRDLFLNLLYLYRPPGICPFSYDSIMGLLLFFFERFLLFNNPKKKKKKRKKVGRWSVDRYRYELTLPPRKDNSHEWTFLSSSNPFASSEVGRYFGHLRR